MKNEDISRAFEDLKKAYGKGPWHPESLESDTGIWYGTYDRKLLHALAEYIIKSKEV